MTTEKGGIPQAEHDRELLRRYLGGDRQAFMEFFRHYQPRLFNFSLGYMKYRALAEDMTQDAFLKFMCRVPNLDFRYAPSTLLFHIAANLCKDSLKSAYARKISLTGDYELDCFRDVRDEQSAGFLKKEIETAVTDCLQSLGHKPRTVYLLKRDAAMTFEEIARTTRIPLRSAKRHLKNAVTAIMEHLEQQGFTLEDLS